MSLRLFLPVLLATSVLSLGCTDEQPSDSGSGGNGTTTTRGLPEGDSTWSGSTKLNGFTFLLDVSLENTGGDLVATTTISDDPDAPAGIGSGTYATTGTHEPVSGLLALAPDRWTAKPNMNIELIGLMGAYDPDTKTISGAVRDYATLDENTLHDAAVELTLVSGDGEPTGVGDQGRALATGSHSFSGTTQCTSSVRETAGTLDYDGAGSISGELKLGDTAIGSPLGSFAFTGVHNPSTGGITLVPGLWIEATSSLLTFFVDGGYDASSGAWTGDMRSPEDSCADDTWMATVE